MRTLTSRNPDVLNHVRLAGTGGTPPPSYGFVARSVFMRLSQLLEQYQTLWPCGVPTCLPIVIFVSGSTHRSRALPQRSTVCTCPSSPAVLDSISEGEIHAQRQSPPKWTLEHDFSRSTQLILDSTVENSCVRYYSDRVLEQKSCPCFRGQLFRYIRTRQSTNRPVRIPVSSPPRCCRQTVAPGGKRSRPKAVCPDRYRTQGQSPAWHRTNGPTYSRSAG